MDYERTISQAKKYRLNWESNWQEIADRVLTEHADFNVKRSPGEQRTNHIYDGTAPLAVNKSAAAIEGLIMPATATWHTLTTDNHDLNQDKMVKEYFDEVNRILFNSRYRNRSGFSSGNHEVLRSMMAFGTGNMYVSEDPSGRGINYRSVFLGDTYLLEDHRRRIDTVVRRIEMTKRQAIQQFGEENLPKRILDEKNDYSEFTFYHVVSANPDYVPHSIRNDERAFKSGYVLDGDFDKPFAENGYYEMPYCVARDVVSSIEIYGRSPAMHVLPEIKGLNTMRKTVIRATHKMADPPMLAPSQGNLGVGGLGGGGLRINMQPNGITFGAVDAQGNQLVKPLVTGARPDLGMAAIEESRRTVNSAFLIDLFQILVETPNMTATEVMARTQEKGILMAPVANRIQTEYLSNMIERELGILERQGMLPEIPGILLEAGAEYSVAYEAPVNKAQRSEEAMAINEILATAERMAAYNPAVMDKIDSEVALEELGEIRGAPNKIFRSDSEVSDIRQARAQQEQQQNMIEEAPALAGAARDLAQARSM